MVPNTRTKREKKEKRMNHHTLVARPTVEKKNVFKENKQCEPTQ
jgi:hypothetical protein